MPPLKKVPQNVAELWAGYDPRKELLRTEVVREWEEDGMTIRYMRYFIGTFKGKPAWMAAFLCDAQRLEEIAGCVARARARARWRAAGEFAFGELPRAARLCGVVVELGRTANGGG